MKRFSGEGATFGAVELRNLTFEQLDELWDNAKEATAPAGAVAGGNK